MKIREAFGMEKKDVNARDVDGRTPGELGTLKPRPEGAQEETERERTLRHLNKNFDAIMSFGFLPVRNPIAQHGENILEKGEVHVDPLKLAGLKESMAKLQEYIAQAEQLASDPDNDQNKPGLKLPLSHNS